MTLSLRWLVVGIVLAGMSGVPGLLSARASRWGQRLATWLMGTSAVVSFAGIALAFVEGRANTWRGLGIDTLSAWFLVPIFLVGGLGAFYGEGYWPQRHHAANGRKVRLFWGLLVAGMGLLVIARHAVVFLVGWEIMALAAFFAMGAEDEEQQVRTSGWTYLVATHVGSLCLFAMFALLHAASGSFALRALGPGNATLAIRSAIFLLALVGFGLKAGIMPLHFWLPGAHANAPSHVSALLSGVMIKMGIYGLVRIASLLPTPPVWWGGMLLILGAVSGACGVLLAIAQHDLKRLLAYHSVENIGIIAMGLGLALLGRSAGRPDWVALGLAGCLLHVWNHGLFKGLLFLGAGSVVHAVGTREIDRLGGLGRRMPWTAKLFVVGAVAICGLPPLNGFVSELFVYLGLMRTAIAGEGVSWPVVALAAPALAMIGALAVACFVKVFGTVFLGEERTGACGQAKESPASMLVPMGILAGFCALIGLVPGLVAPLLQTAVAAAAPELADLPSLAGLVPFAWVSAGGLALLAAIVLLWAGYQWLLRNRVVRRASTWDCGYAAASPRVQYTASSFGQFLVSLFAWLLKPRIHEPRVHGAFPKETSFASHVDDGVLDRWLLPIGRRAENWLGRFRRLQQGLAQSYLLYILVAVLVLMLWGLPWGETLGKWFSR